MEKNNQISGKKNLLSAKEKKNKEKKNKTSLHGIGHSLLIRAGPKVILPRQ